MKRHLLTILTLIFALLAFGSRDALAQVYTPPQMPNVQVADKEQYVSDPAGLLSEATTRRVNALLAQLRSATTVEMVVAIPPEIGDVNAAEWSEQLFTLWKIGKKDKDNGVLLMISPGSRTAYIMPGYGAEGVLTDIVCAEIFRNIIKPNMKRGDLDGAVLESVNAIIKILETPEAVSDIMSRQPDNQGELTPLDSNVFWTFALFLVGVLALFGLWIMVAGHRASRKCHDNYGKAEAWRSRLKMLGAIAICSAGMLLPMFIWAYAAYRYWRMKQLRCAVCNAKMRRLPEDKDNEYLTDSQDFEERLGTVDYDVWECPSCGAVERYAYKADQKKYTKCPKCGTLARCLVADVTTVPSTIHREGEGMKIYECQYCRNRDNHRYRKPKKEDPSAALAAAAVIGAAAGRSRGGFGGGSMGGGFGGGATGGGGSGGSW